MFDCLLFECLLILWFDCGFGRVVFYFVWVYCGTTQFYLVSLIVW